MILRYAIALAFVFSLAGKWVSAEEGIPVGSVAPVLRGGAWIGDDKQPDLEGKVYLVDFWFERCPACLASIPSVKSIAERYAKKGLIVIGASLDPSQNVQAFMNRNDIRYPMLSSARPAAAAYGIHLFPSVFLVGKRGRVLWKGFINDSELPAEIDAALRTNS